MHDLSVTILALGGLLALASVLLPVAQRFHYPFTVLLALVGILLGLGLEFIEGIQVSQPVRELADALSGFRITAEMVLFVFLPTLIFESALSLDVRHLMRNLGPILMLAVVGLLVSTLIVGVALEAWSGQPLLLCLLLGAIVSATDPVAVVALFRDLGAPERLTLLVEGESLFNDATAIVLFTLLLGMLTGGTDATVASGIVTFAQVFLGGVVAGWLIARGACALLGKLPEMPVAETTLTVCLAYIVFIVAEHHLHVSGVMAVVTAGLVIGSTGRRVVSHEGWEDLSKLWEWLGFWANSLIFLLVGMRAPSLLEGVDTQLTIAIAILIAAAIAARALILFGLFPLFGRVVPTARMSASFRTVMFWGGLRGAVSLALALLVLETPQLDADSKGFVTVLVTALVLFTLFVNAPTVRPLLSLFGLDRLPRDDIAVRDRMLTRALRQVRDQVEGLAEACDMEDEGVRQPVLQEIDSRIRDADEEIGREALPEDVAVRIGLRALLDLERHGYESYFDDGVISSGTYRVLGAHVGVYQDALRDGGMERLEEVCAASLDYGRVFRLALGLHRRTGWDRPLARTIARRSELLLAQRTVLRELGGAGMETVATISGEAALGQVSEFLRGRLERTEEALNALRVQYPDFTRELQRIHLMRMGLHHEEERYRRLYQDGVFGDRVLSSLNQALESRMQEASAMPVLDLGLEPRLLLSRVPLFEHLPEANLHTLAGILHSMLVLPGEKVVTEGEIGDAMYFISSGALKVEVDPPVTLGTGDFFGEIALLEAQPRNADVTALGFCEVLVLDRDDFRSVMAGDETLSEEIRRVARDRLGRRD